jgi:hypothetical protein
MSNKNREVLVQGSNARSSSSLSMLGDDPVGLFALQSQSGDSIPNKAGMQEYCFCESASSQHLPLAVGDVRYQRSVACSRENNVWVRNVSAQSKPGGNRSSSQQTLADARSSSAVRAKAPKVPKTF